MSMPLWTEFVNPMPMRSCILKVTVDLLASMLVGGSPRMYTSNAPPDMKVVGWRADLETVRQGYGYVELLVASAGFERVEIGEDYPVLDLRFQTYQPEDEYR